MDRSRRRALHTLGMAGLAGLPGCLRAGEAQAGPPTRGNGDRGFSDRGGHEADIVGTRDRSENTDDTGTEALVDDQEDVRPDEPDDRDASRDEERPSPALPENGVVAFVYHDGPINDYTEAFPAHEAFDTVATTCPVSGWIGREYGVAERLGLGHLRALGDAGWEIASHTTDHATLGEFALLEDCTPDDARIYPAAHRHGHLEGLQVEITDGETSVRRTVDGYGSDDRDERYVELSEPLGTAFKRGETAVRWPEHRMHYTLGASKEALEEWGFQVDTLLAPYDNFGDYAMRFVPTYYDYVANASRDKPRINGSDGYDPYRTRQRYFIEYTAREHVKDDLDHIAETGALGVFGAHTFKDEVTEDRIRETLQWIEDRGIAVRTFREAAAMYAGGT